METKIPNQFHFIWGLKKRKEPFHLCYYLCLESCLRINQPNKILQRGTELNYVSSQGLNFTVPAEHDVQKIECWSDNRPTPLPLPVTTFARRTKEGVGMGANQEQIVAALGQPERTDSKADFENLYYDKQQTN